MCYMSLKFVVVPFKQRLFVRDHLQVIVKDFLGLGLKANRTKGKDGNSLQRIMSWLKYAQDIRKDGGVSAGYSFRHGWLPSYPETTGYIITSFLEYYHLTNEDEYLNRAIRMGDWLVSIQLDDGAFQGGFADAPLKPIVFNTGQVVQGLVRIYKETQDEKYLKAAVNAADWLVGAQDDDGAWRRSTYNGIPHVYHTRVAWPLLELYQVVLDESYLRAATKNIDWSLSNQEENGWFKNNAFDSKSDPFLHTIAYAIEGLLECAALMQNENWLEAAIKPAEVLLKELEMRGKLAGVYNDKWQGVANYRCLTGEAQMSVCWLRLFQLTGDRRLLNCALRMNGTLRALQDIKSSNPGIRSGVKGSHPIWGGYQAFMYPNWAAKFFADALMLEEKLR